jgi:hypothetical protein
MNAIPVISFSTGAQPGVEAFDAWRETFALKVARVDVTTPDRASFHADIRVRPCPASRCRKIDSARAA